MITQPDPSRTPTQVQTTPTMLDRARSAVFRRFGIDGVFPDSNDWYH